MEKHPLSDLRFFRFPEITADVVVNIVLLVVLLIVTVAVTVIAQRRLSDWSRIRHRRQAFDRFSSTHHMPPPVRDVLERLGDMAGVKDGFELVRDAEAFESAVERLLAGASEAVEQAMAALRRSLHLNVMNPDLELVSTRQLLQDLPVRLLIAIEEERLDLYCSLFKVTEAELLFDLPPQEEIQQLLRSHPGALLFFWRETEGETLFPITLEPIEVEGFSLFRANHAFRDPEMAQRATFRLTLNRPMQYKYMEHRGIRGARSGKKDPTLVQEGEGRVVDLSYGGASLLVSQPLPPGGFAQLTFDLYGQSMRMMLEVLSQFPLSGGQYRVRGRFPVHPDEDGDRLHKTLVREQLKRLRESKLLHFKPDA